MARDGGGVAQSDTTALRGAAIEECVRFLRRGEDISDTDVKRAKLALGMWATIAKENQTRSAIAAIQAGLARAIASDARSLARFAVASHPGTPLAELAAVTVEQSALAEVNAG